MCDGRASARVLSDKIVCGGVPRGDIRRRVSAESAEPRAGAGEAYFPRDVLELIELKTRERKELDETQNHAQNCDRHRCICQIGDF